MNEAEQAGRARSLIDRVVLPHRPVLAIVLMACFLYLPCVWLRDLWNPDEPRYAEVAREMVARGDYMLPHLNGAVYGEKPPLFFWLGIAAGSLPGVPFASGTRLVSVLAALGTLLLTFRLGRRYGDAETGWLAALVLATSAMFVVHASSGVIDGTLTFLVVAAIAIGLRARETASPIQWAAFYGLAGLAIITKGPVGLVIPGGLLLLLALQEYGARRMWAVHPVWGLAIILAVAAAWLVPAISRGGAAYAEIILFKQNLGRAYQSWHHQEPLQFFLKVFPGSFLPWVVLLPTAIYGAWKDRAASRASRLALTWFGFTFLFFSVISGKKTRYLLPLFPAASLLVALDLRALLPEARRVVSRWRHRYPLALCGVILALCGLGMMVAPFGPAARSIGRLHGLAPDQQAGLLRLSHFPEALSLLLPGILIFLLALGGLVGLGGLGGLVGRTGIARAGRVGVQGRAALACIMAGWIGLVAWGQWVGVPALDIIKSARPLAEAAVKAAGPDGGIIMYRASYAGMFNVYTGRDRIEELSGLDKTAGWLQEHPGAVVLTSVQDVDRLRSKLAGLETVACRRMGNETVCVARSPTPPP